MTVQTGTTSGDTTTMQYANGGGVGYTVHQTHVHQYNQYGGWSPELDRILQTTRLNTYDGANRMTTSAAVWDSLEASGMTIHARYYQNQEKYRYDALGRRVWTQIARDTQCVHVEPLTNCGNASTYTIWDGSQILYETNQTATYLPSWAVAGGGVPTRTVRYLHGPEIDEPLEVTDGSLIVFPIANYRGSINTGGCPLSTCTQIVFPSATRGVYGEWQPANAWFGTLLTAPNDGSGYVYQEPVSRSGVGAVHAGGSDWDCGRVEYVWICEGGSGHVFRSFWVDGGSAVRR